MVLTKQELLKKISELGLTDTVCLELMEDITDSFPEENSSVTEERVEEIQKKYDDLLQKYKDRFLNPEKITDDEKLEELEEKEFINITEI